MEVGRIEFQTVYTHTPTPPVSNHEKRIADLERRVVEVLERLHQLEQELLLATAFK